MSTGNRKRRRAAGLLPEPQKCVARKKDGTPCKRSPIKGASVCRAHGGAAPQVQRKAAERIANASDIAVLQILALMQAPDTPAPVKLAAARDLLDRANVSGKTTVELEVPLWQQLLDGIVATVPEGSELRAFAEGQGGPDPLVVEAERVEAERELESYQTAPHGEDWSDDFAYGSEPPAPPPVQKPPMRDGADRPPPKHPMPGPRRIEPGDDDFGVPRTYTPGPRPPTRGRIAGGRR